MNFDYTKKSTTYDDVSKRLDNLFTRSDILIENINANELYDKGKARFDMMCFKGDNSGLIHFDKLVDSMYYIYKTMKVGKNNILNYNEFSDGMIRSCFIFSSNVDMDVVLDTYKERFGTVLPTNVYVSSVKNSYDVLRDVMNDIYSDMYKEQKRIDDISKGRYSNTVEYNDRKRELNEEVADDDYDIDELEW